jgi:probable LLM family oxidoreductase
MEIGIDSFAASSHNKDSHDAINDSQSLAELLERIEYADQVGIDNFGIGEHHRKEFLDSAPSMILAAAAARTKNIKLHSAVTVLSAADPVRVFQNYATLDLISNGRAEIVAGRGSFTDAFPLFGLNLSDYDALFEEKLELLLAIRDHETINWSGKFRPSLHSQNIYPRPLQKLLPIWVGVGGTPASFVRAGKLGLPLMVAVIGGETHRFRPLIDLYKSAGAKAGHPPEKLRVGLHSLGYVSKTKEEAINNFYPGYEKVMNNIGKERGWAPMQFSHFKAQTSEAGAIVIGDPEEVAQKILRHSEALGGISRFSFQMDFGLSHEQLMQAIKLIGKEVSPLVNYGLMK